MNLKQAAERPSKSCGMACVTMADHGVGPSHVHRWARPGSLSLPPRGIKRLGQTALSGALSCLSRVMALSSARPPGADRTSGGARRSRGGARGSRAPARCGSRPAARTRTWSSLLQVQQVADDLSSRAPPRRRVERGRVHQTVVHVSADSDRPSGPWTGARSRRARPRRRRGPRSEARAARAARTSPRARGACRSADREELGVVRVDRPSV
jgi:hypothetical protein